MAWIAYYVNSDRIAGIEESERDICIMYDSKVPPHGSIRREWTTRGMKHGDSKIFFVEYRLEDDDPDGVWEAYGMKAESEYTFTVNAENADPEKLFVYVLCKDGGVCRDFGFDPDNAVAIFVLPRPMEVTEEQLTGIYEKAMEIPWKSDEVEKIIAEELLGGSETELCLAYLLWRSAR